MLPDLHILKEESHKRIEDNLSLELRFDEGTRQRILELYKEKFSDYPATLQDGLIKISNKQSQTAYLPFNWFVRIKQCKPLIDGLTVYGSYVDQLRPILADKTLRNLPKVEWLSSPEIPEDEKQALQDFIDRTFSEQTDRDKFNQFIDGRSWLEIKNPKKDNTLSGKKLNRASIDFIASCITTQCKLINDTAGKLEHFIKLYLAVPELREVIDDAPEMTATDDAESRVSVKATINHPKKEDFVNTSLNKIVYGAPGTGKSYSIKNGLDETNLIRTVFHPDTQYSDFVGSLKPIMLEDCVGYEFRPGPFTEAIIKAINKPKHSITLIIEEINRASAAAVFGEIFQLLDRGNDGHSEYSIDVSDPDLLAYLNSKTYGYFKDGKLFIPSNLALLATMNSSDQAVMPMDTAFKRRWEFSYLKIDYANASEGELTIPVSSIDNHSALTIKWSTFAQVINEQLSSENVPEDRLLGHRFLSENELEKNPEGSLKGKLFMYLWDDVLRHGQHSVVFKEDVELTDGETTRLNTFGHLVNAFEAGEAVFNDTVEQRLLDVHNNSQAN
ncbi:McrB family protein [Vibrio coralliilyticus]|uniref:McrB family protein n=1 Tax=Vibrio coralliilyticus TaxID=190893 RepID=UPI00155F8008|nr:AAA family ATPase [Vibrio coralliilyticus]NRF28899.1 AAA family ATPase [Vibrio coralliilyticus]NRF50850.1 AAA family ATPase [Vibrio coralliilyticus]NRG05138.1 AAA family ATPase [Vibrio coralliilyticus]